MDNNVIFALAMGVGTAEQLQRLPFAEGVLQVARMLNRMSVQDIRDLETETRLAIETNKFMHRNDHPDFQIYGVVEAEIAYRTDYYPRSVLSVRPDLKKWAEGRGYTDVPALVDAKTVQGYIGGFEQGSELGYEQELGNGWFFTLGATGGHYYIPVGKFIRLVNAASIRRI